MTAIKERTMGRVTISVKIENAIDRGLVKLGYIVAEKVRAIEVAEALVDTGAARLCLNKELIGKLGLTFVEESLVDTAKGCKKAGRYTDAWVTVMGRSCPADVLEIDSKTPALVGYLILEALDLAVDPKARKVTTNPQHNGEMIIDLL